MSTADIETPLVRAPVAAASVSGRPYELMNTVRGLGRELWSDPISFIGFVILVALVLTAILAPLLAPFGLPPDSALEPVAMPLSAEERARAERWWRERAPSGETRMLVNISASSAERRWADERFVGPRATRPVGPLVRRRRVA